MRFALAMALASVTLVLTTASVSAQISNECTTVVLHAISGIDPDCQTALDCSSVPPNVRIDNPAGLYTVLMYLKNYGTVNGVQVAFDWPATWSFGFGLWNCQVGQVFGTQPTAPGPRTGTIATAFNPISGGALAPIGFMVFNSLGSGCLSIVESSFPDGNCVLDQFSGGPEITHLLDVNEGRVCVGSDGWNTCECQGATAVESSTWGQIKVSY